MKGDTQMSYKTTTVQATTTEGQTMDLTIPASLPSNERADYLRGLWDAHVAELDDHWKGRVQAVVTNDLADDVAEAMEFMGALVDKREAMGGGRKTWIFSQGYWAHGF